MRGPTRCPLCWLLGQPRCQAPFTGWALAVLLASVLARAVLLIARP